MRHIFITLLLSLLLLPLQADGSRLTDTVKIMSFNIRFETPKDTGEMSWTSRQPAIRRMFEEIRPDIVGVQEPRHQMLESTYSLLPAHRHFKIESCDSITDAMTGNIIIFYDPDRFEAVDSGFFWLSPTPEQASLPWNSTDTHYRCALWMKLRDRRCNKTFVFCTTHFPYKKAPVDTEVRARCSALICERMRQLAGNSGTVFVTGDMNASWADNDPRRAGIAPFFEAMKSARHDAEFSNNRSSFNGFGRVSPEIRGKNLDHIFYNNARAILFETIDYPGYGVRWISDHYPIMCHFEI